METVNLGIETALFEELMRRVKTIPFYNFLGMKVKSIGPGTAEIEVETQEAYGNVDGSTHGGVIMAAADAAMAMAVRSLGAATTTVQMDVCFMRHGTVGEKITAKGWVVKAGRRIVFSGASVFCAGKEIAMIEGTFFRTGDILPKAE